MRRARFKLVGYRKAICCYTPHKKKVVDGAEVIKELATDETRINTEGQRAKG